MHAKLNYILYESERTTDTQRAFFRKSQTFGLGRTNWTKHFWGHLEYFWPIDQHPFW